MIKQIRHRPLANHPTRGRELTGVNGLITPYHEVNGPHMVVKGLRLYVGVGSKVKVNGKRVFV